MIQPLFRTLIHQAVPRGLAAGLGLTAAWAIAPVALAQLTTVESGSADLTPVESTATEVGSESLTTQPAQVSLSDLVDSRSDAIRVTDRPTLVFDLGDRMATPREQIQENKPENSNAIHFPLEN